MDAGYLGSIILHRIRYSSCCAVGGQLASCCCVPQNCLIIGPKVLFCPWRVMKTDLSRCLVLGCRRRRCIGRFMRSCLRSPVQPLTPERKSSSTLRISYDVIYDACKLSNGFSSQYVMSLRSSMDGRIRFACNSIIIRYGVERKYLERIQKFLKRLNFSACKLKIAKMKESHNHV